MIIPSIFPEHRKHEHAEKKVYEQLFRLADKYDIFYHRKFSDGYTIPFELDFAISNRRRSILLMEVKGGQITYKDNVWRSYQTEISNPQDQVSNHLRSFVNRYNLQGAIWVDTCLAFPDTPGGIGERPDSLQEYQIFCQEHFYDLEQALEYAFAESRKKRNWLKTQLNAPAWLRDMPDTMPEQQYRRLIKDLCGNVNQNIPLAKRLTLQENRILELTEAQYLIYECCRDNEKLVIEGVAGSGKTALAVKIAADEYHAGKSVLLLCHNLMLGNIFENEITGIAKLERENKIDGGACHTFLRQIFPDIYDQEKALETREQKNEFYEITVPDLIGDRMKLGPSALQYDTLIIDEAQDFTDFMMDVLLNVVAEDGKVVLFKDKMQNVWRKSEMPLSKEFFKVKLFQNVRNTKAIIRYINKLLNLELESGLNNLEGEPVQIYTCKDKREQLRSLSEAIRLLYHDIKSTDDMLILVPENMSYVDHCLNGQTEINGFRLDVLPDNLERQPNTIYYTRISKFKGLEIAYLFVPNLELFQSMEYYTNYMYTALTRAKHRLYVWEVQIM